MLGVLAPLQTMHLSHIFIYRGVEIFERRVEIIEERG